MKNRSAIIMICLVAGLSSFAKADLARDELEVTLLKQRKVKKLSPLKVCKTGPFRLVKFSRVKDPDDPLAKEKFMTEIDDISTSKYIDPSSTHIHEARDINGDGLLDLLVFIGGCGSSGDCEYEVLAHCGKDKYAAVGPKDKYMNDARLGTKSTVVGKTKWLQLEDYDRIRYQGVTCQGYNGDFAIERHWEFDGHSYVINPAEDKRVQKLVDAEIQTIKTACKKK